MFPFNTSSNHEKFRMIFDGFSWYEKLWPRNGSSIKIYATIKEQNTVWAKQNSIHSKCVL